MFNREACVAYTVHYKAAQYTAVMIHLIGTIIICMYVHNYYVVYVHDCMNVLPWLSASLLYLYHLQVWTASLLFVASYEIYNNVFKFELNTSKTAVHTFYF